MGSLLGPPWHLRLRVQIKRNFFYKRNLNDTTLALVRDQSDASAFLTTLNNLHSEIRFPTTLTSDY